MPLTPVLFLVSVTVTNAQFHSLATNDDGSVVYFATSMSQKGTSQPLHGKIFRADASGVVPVASRDAEPPVAGYTNYFDLSAPDVSGDGSVVAFAKSRACFGASACVARELTRSEIHGLTGSPDLELTGSARLSQNGRFAVYTSGISGPADIGPAIADLERDTATPASGSLRRGTFAGHGRVISNAGEFVYVQDGLLLVQQTTGGLRATRLVSAAAEQILGPVIDAAGTVVVYASRWPSPHNRFTRLRIFNRRQGTVRTLVEGYGDFYQPVVSNDGLGVLYLSTARVDGAIGPPQAFVINIDGTNARQLTQPDEGIVEAVMSGDGRFVGAVTGQGALVRIDTASGNATEAIGRTPSVRSARLARGSIGSLEGLGLAEKTAGAQTLPLPLRLGGFSARLEGVFLPVSRVSATSAEVQIPWELPLSNLNLSVETGAISGWNSPPSTIQVVDAAPAFALAGPYPPAPLSGYPIVPVVAAHGDWTALVSEGNPAQAGEPVHLYGMGFGPTNAEPRSGEPAPIEPLPELRIPLACRVRNAENALRAIRVLYAGLAPGFVGTYQISVRIPGDLDSTHLFAPGFLGIECELGTTGVSPAFALLPVKPGL